MKSLPVLFLLLFSAAYGQLTLADAVGAAGKYQIGFYSYHEEFMGHDGYASPRILCADGGAAIIGDYEDSTGRGCLFVKLDKNGEEELKVFIRPEFDELETQSVLSDDRGNFYLFMLTYDHERYRGGSQRIVCLKSDGTILWDKTFGDYELVNNPTFSYIRLMTNGQINLRGHIVTDQPEEDKDPVYHYWEAWMSQDGKIIEEVGVVIDWSNQKWQERYKPE